MPRLYRGKDGCLHEYPAASPWSPSAQRDKPRDSTGVSYPEGHFSDDPQRDYWRAVDELERNRRRVKGK